jgi:hypothetical protein
MSDREDGTISAHPKDPPSVIRVENFDTLEDESGFWTATKAEIAHIGVKGMIVLYALLERCPTISSLEIGAFNGDESVALACVYILAEALEGCQEIQELSLLASNTPLKAQTRLIASVGHVSSLTLAGEEWDETCVPQLFELLSNLRVVRLPLCGDAMTAFAVGMRGALRLDRPDA